MQETALNSIKTLKRYYKITLNVCFNKKKFDDDKKIYLYDMLYIFYFIYMIGY